MDVKVEAVEDSDSKSVQDLTVFVSEILIERFIVVGVPSFRHSLV